MATDRPVAVLNIANILTIIRLVLVPVFVYLYLLDTLAGRAWAAAVFIVAALTDRLDGHLARSRGLITDLGKLLDPIADKALVLSALFVLSIGGMVPWWVTILIVIRELGITLLRMAMVRRHVMAASAGGKLKTALQMTFIIGLLIPWEGFMPWPIPYAMVMLSLITMYLALAVTLVTGVMYVQEAARLRRQEDEA